MTSLEVVGRALCTVTGPGLTPAIRAGKDCRGRREFLLGDLAPKFGHSLSMRVERHARRTLISDHHHSSPTTTTSTQGSDRLLRLCWRFLLCLCVVDHGWRWQRDGSRDEAAAATTLCMGSP